MSAANALNAARFLRCVSDRFETACIKELTRSKQIKGRINAVKPFCKYGNLSPGAIDPDRILVYYFLVYQIAIIFKSPIYKGTIRSVRTRKVTLVLSLKVGLLPSKRNFYLLHWKPISFSRYLIFCLNLLAM